MASISNNQEEDRVLPFNPSMFSPREGDITGRGPANGQPIVGVGKSGEKD